MKRPGKPIRVFIVVAAVACLGLAMCHSTKKPEAPAAAASGSAEPAAASGSAPVQQANPPAQKPRPKQPYFPATKSAGPLR